MSFVNSTVNSIASHETKGDVPPYPDTKVTLAFGDDVFPVLVHRLDTESEEVLLSALQAAIRLLPSPLNAVKAVEAGAIAQFVRLAHHPSVDVRKSAATALDAAISAPAAKAAFVEGGHLDSFRDVVCDASIDVQLLALHTIDVLGSVVPWPDALQKSGYVGVLVDLARKSDSMDVKAAALRCLVRVVGVDSAGQAEAVNSCNAVPVLVDMFGPAYGGRVREDAARVLALLCFLPEGRAAAVTANVIPPLLTLMQDRAPGVRAEAAGAAMALAVDNDAKREFVKAGLAPLVGLVSDPSRIVRINAMRAVTSLSASPDARSLLRGMNVLDAIKKQLDSADPLEATVADKAHAVVDWRP